ncbi:MAG: S1 RNA-binding domain-containing protein [Chloroflexota bacterium]
MIEAQSQPYSIGQTVKAKIEKIASYGVFVRLEDDTLAYCRRRELSWDSGVRPQDVVDIGEEIKVQVLPPSDQGKLTEVSLKKTLPDPWDEFISRFKIGDVISGSVKDIRDYGIFVQILPGVDGFISTSELVSWKIESPADIFWIEDDVEAIITSVDRTKKKVRLSIRQHLASLVRYTEIVQAVRARLTSEERKATNDAPIPPESEGSSDDSDQADDLDFTPLGRVLVVEDRNEICEPLAIWLRDKGCEASAALTTSQAQAYLSHATYDLLIVDVDLPDQDGLHFLQQLQAKNLAIKTIVMSIPETLEERSQDIEDLNTLTVFAKPLDLDEIASTLMQITKGKSPRYKKDASLSANRSEILESLRHFEVNLGQDRSLESGLKRIVTQTKAEMGILFHLNPLSKQVNMVAKYGLMPINESATFSLDESPVNDIIVDGDYLYEPAIPNQKVAKYQKLLDFIQFSSCIGIPVEVRGTRHHALFLFRSQKNGFGSEQFQAAVLMSHLIAILLEQAILDDKIRSMDRLILSGQLASGFGHEVFNKMSGLGIQIQNLETDFKLLERSIPNSEVKQNFKDIHQAIASLGDTAADLRNTVGLFRQLMLPEKTVHAKINEALHHTHTILRPTAQRSRVKILIDVSSTLPDTPARRISLRQILLNIMLNALQHLKDTSQKERLLEIMVEFEETDEELPIKVRFQDNGPGIHKQLWNEIFNLGFSTRVEGTGLGLFITKSLVESIGGRVSVESSVIPLGTTFLLELPIVHEREEISDD